MLRALRPIAAAGFRGLPLFTTTLALMIRLMAADKDDSRQLKRLRLLSLLPSFRLIGGAGYDAEEARWLWLLMIKHYSKYRAAPRAVSVDAHEIDCRRDYGAGDCHGNGGCCLPRAVENSIPSAFRLFSAITGPRIIFISLCWRRG